MACLAVPDGTIVIGGIEMKNSVYLFKMEKWYSIGTLNSVCSLSALLILLIIMIGPQSSCRDSIQ